MEEKLREEQKKWKKRNDKALTIIAERLAPEILRTLKTGENTHAKDIWKSINTRYTIVDFEAKMQASLQLDTLHERR